MSDPQKFADPPSTPLVPTDTDVQAIIDVALAEDLNSPDLSLSADLTTAWTLDPRTTASAKIIAKQRGVVAGIGVACATFKRLDPAVQFLGLVDDGTTIDVSDVVLDMEGSAHALLTGERTALNLLQRLSGTASLTRQFVIAVASTGVRITDTRKTTPGLRQLEKYAVCCGGGVSHRHGLYDAVLIKENHAAAVGGVMTAVQLARQRARTTGDGRGDIRIMVEARELAEVYGLCSMESTQRPDRILLDNMSVDQLREAVSVIRHVDPPIIIEATGGIGLHNVREIATTGVDLISIGALTHSAPALDLSLLMTQRA